MENGVHCFRIPCKVSRRDVGKLKRVAQKRRRALSQSSSVFLGGFAQTLKKQVNDRHSLVEMVVFRMKRLFGVRLGMLTAEYQQVEI